MPSNRSPSAFALTRGFLPVLIAFASIPFVQGAQDDWQDLYDPFRIRTIHLQMESGSSWGSVVSDSDFNNPQNALLSTDDETPIPVTVKRKSDPAVGQKVSVKIDINARVPGQTWHGVKKLSLENGADGGIVKEGLAWQMHRLASEAGFYRYPSAHAAWVRLIVDGQVIGLYTSVEERDKQMLENRGMWKENATWLYKNDPNPELEAGQGNSPAFQHFCFSPFKDRNGCPLPADPETDLNTWIDMQGLLTLGAVEAFTGNHDGLFTHDGKNHFFADFAPAPRLQRLYFPWDLDTGISDVNKPILGSAGAYSTVILGHPWFRAWYLHTMTDLLNGPLSTASLTDFLNRLEPVMTSALQADPNSSVEPAGHFESLRVWVTNRIANVRGQIGPVIGPPVMAPGPGEIVAGMQLTLSHTNVDGTIYYTLNGRDPRAVGGAAAGFAYSAPIVLSNSAHLKARVLVGTNWSALREGTFNVAGHAARLKVTEIMYSPPSTNEDAGEYEFIEFQNRSAQVIDLSGCHVTGVDFRFLPGTVVGSGEFVLLVRNGVAFANRYPGVPYNGIFWGGLDKNGEKIRVRNSDGNTALSVEYDDEVPWPLGSAGLGWSLVNLAPENNPDSPANWRASANRHGSPGAVDPQPAYNPGAVISEVLANTESPLEDAIELHNPTANPIDISGWYLSDQLDNDATLKKYRIPDGTTIPARSFKVFYESNFNAGANAFALSSYGDQVYLSSADSGGALTGCIMGANFGASDPGGSIGQFRTSYGFDFTGLEVTTPGDSNSTARIGPVVINEIMFRSDVGGAEFIEFYNRTTTNVDLSAWTVEGASFTFPESTIIPGNSFLILLGSTDVSPAEFRVRANVPSTVPVLAHPFDLGNAGENIELKKPNDFPTNAAIRVDRVRYNDKGAWPGEADGQGPSLERLSPHVYGNEPLNWRTTRTGGSAGRPNDPSTVIAIARASSWKHNFLGRNLGLAWRIPGYSDSGWKADEAPLGYGAPSLATVLTNQASVSPITTYLRKQFVINDDTTSISNLTLRVNYDDGFVAWLNGQELLRRQIPPGPVNNSTLAAEHGAGGYETITITAQKGLLTRGLNVLAVEVHQHTTNDADLFWDAELTYQTGTGAGAEPTPVRITELRRDTSGVVLRWVAVATKSYQVQSSADLQNWSDAGSALTATGETAEFIDSSTTPALKFYRVLSLP